MKRIEPVAAYIRVSTTEQKLHGLSLDAQKMKLKEYVKKHNMKIEFASIFFQTQNYNNHTSTIRQHLLSQTNKKSCLF